MPVGSLVRVIVQEHIPGLAEVTVLIRRGGRVVPVAMRLDGAKGRWELVELQDRPPAGARRRAKEEGPRQAASKAASPARSYPQSFALGLSLRPGLHIVGAMKLGSSA